MASAPEANAPAAPATLTVPEASTSGAQSTSTAASGSAPTPAPAAEKKLTAAEIKAKAKAEKQAKRAAKKAEEGGAAGPSAGPSQGQANSTSGRPNRGEQQQRGQQGNQQQQRGGGGRQGRQQQGAAQTALTAAIPTPVKVNVSSSLFQHLTISRRTGIPGTSKDVHPAIQAYGLQVSNYEICGSTARCVAMLQAFKAITHSYAIPPNNSLARHFIPHHLSPQIEHIKNCRPISIGMGNAIRFFKEAIVKIDPNTPEGEAKESLIEALDRFIQERIIAADELIATSTSARIADGDVILTFARSSIVERILLQAHNDGRRFRVIVVDTKPLNEGKLLAKDLSDEGIDVDYYLLTGIEHAMAEATQVLVGAHAMMGDGRLFSRIGTAVVAMHAHELRVPLMVCCETYKFTERIWVDSFSGNELAPPEELLSKPRERDEWLKKMKANPMLKILNPLYDLTPKEYVAMIATEYGNLPASSVPVVLRTLENRSQGGSR